MLTTLDRQEPDRVPLGEWGIDHDTVEKVIGHETFWRNRRAETIAFWEGRRDEVVQSWKEDLVDLTDRLDMDLVPVFMAPPRGMEATPMVRLDETTWEDPRGGIHRYTPANDAILCVQPAPPRALRSREQVREHFEREVVPSWGFRIDSHSGGEYRFSLDDESRLELVRAVVRAFGGRRFIFARDFSEWESPVGGEGAEFYLSLVESPDLVSCHFQLVTELHIARAGVYLDEGVDAIMPGGDFADSNGPLVSPEVIRRLFLPGMRRLSDYVHSRGARMMSHNCGNNWKLMDLLVAAGYEAYQSIQARTATMDLARLKQEYGRAISLWGGINIETLHDGTPDDNRADVVYALRHAAPGGGFILGTSNSVSYGSRYENYRAAVDAARRFGKYPIGEADA